MSDMIPDLENYFKRFIPPRDEFLLALEQEARDEDIPIVGPVVGALLYILVSGMQAGKVLELGTATGYSAIYLARGCAPNGQVITLEKNEGMAARARANFEKASVQDRIQIRLGDAIEMMAGIPPFFDFIFLDIDKEDYLQSLPHCERVLRRGGIMVCDNVGFQDARNFNERICHNTQWKSVHLLSLLPLHSPEKDGLCIALRC